MTNHLDGWLTIREAALALGVSELTIRRRIKDRKVVHRLHDGKYYVDLDASITPEISGPRVMPMITQISSSDQSRIGDGASHGDSDEIPHSPPALSLNLDALFTEQRRLAEMAGRSEQLDQQLRELQEQHSRLQEGVLALSSRNGWLESKLEEREQTIKLLTDSGHTPSWWKRIFGGGST